MRAKHADQGYRKFWPLMKSMTWKERIEHIIYYYAKYVLLGAFLIYLGVSLAVDMLSPGPEVILSGTTVNVNMAEEMKLSLVEDTFAAMGGTDRTKQAVNLTPNQLGTPTLNGDSEIQSILAKFQSFEYHYVIMDKKGMDILIAMPALSDLTLIIPAEKLSPWSERLVIAQVGGQEVPVAIDITGTVLAASCSYDGEGLYLSFPVNEAGVPIAERFLDYLTGQGLLEIQ